MTDTAVVEQDALPICPECQEPFSTHRGLASHMKKHARPTTCPICGEGVRYLAPHLAKEHPERTEGEELVDSVRRLVEENLKLKARISELEAGIPDSPDSQYSSLPLRGERNNPNNPNTRIVESEEM